MVAAAADDDGRWWWQRPVMTMAIMGGGRTVDTDGRRWLKTVTV